MNYIVNVEGAVVNDDRYLMVIRGEAETHASGALSFIGGKVETISDAEHVLEDTLRREILEEVGVNIGEMAYVQSSHFIAEDGDRVVDVVFLCRYATGEAHIGDAGEVAEVLWLSADEIMQHPACPPWTRQGILRVEERRQQLGW
jgi:8-oxo-dGTP diphosphatase